MTLLLAFLLGWAFGPVGIVMALVLGVAVAAAKDAGARP
jgi:hypothetical protein